MKVFILLFVPLYLLTQTNPKTERVKSYYKRNGTTVRTYRRTAPNHTTKDNYSHSGNTNPNTGKKGYKKK